MAGNNETHELRRSEERSGEKRKGSGYANQVELVQSLIDGACTEDEAARTIRDTKSTISTADLIRLMQFQREMVKEQPVDIVEMRWIDPPKRQ
jgi:LDH2 family malate/lactate/ureidoglycolate dehydrogenase